LTLLSHVHLDERVILCARSTWKLPTNFIKRRIGHSPDFIGIRRVNILEHHVPYGARKNRYAARVIDIEIGRTHPENISSKGLSPMRGNQSRASPNLIKTIDERLTLVVHCP